MKPPRTTRLVPRAYKSLFTYRELRRLLPALAVSDLGDGMSIVAVAWLAVQIAPPGQSGLYVGAAIAACALPGAIGALVFGRWLRRLPARRLLAVDCWLRVLCLGGVTLAWVTGVLHPILYVVLLAGSSVLHAWGSAGKYALIAQILPPERRLPANALVSSSASASIIIGPALAGFLAAAVNPAWIIGVNALSFVVLAVQVGRLGEETRAAPTPAPIDTVRSASGLRVLRGQPELLGILALTWFFNFLYGPVEVALPLHVTEDLDTGSSVLGLYWTLFGVGAVLGSLTAGSLRKLPVWPVTLAIVAGWGLTLVPFGLGAPTATTLVCFALGGFIYGPFTTLSYTLFQDRTPAAWLTTVLAARGAALLTAAPLGTALGGPLVAALGPRLTLGVSGAATLVLAFTAAGIWARARYVTTTPAGAPPAEDRSG